MLTLDQWVPEITHHCQKTPFLLVGTQIDLRDENTTLEKLAKNKQKPITMEQGEKLAKELKAVKYVECSALTQVNFAFVNGFIIWICICLIIVQYFSRKRKRCHIIIIKLNTLPKYVKRTRRLRGCCIFSGNVTLPNLVERNSSSRSATLPRTVNHEVIAIFNEFFENSLKNQG